MMQKSFNMSDSPSADDLQNSNNILNISRTLLWYVNDAH